MRILELRLTAFGPFTGVDLPLERADESPHAAGEAALHLVYGHNEAGKSTALRGLAGLLYGIPERTSDAHVHPMGKLRIGAKLLSSDGNVLDLVRKKGRKQTLLSPDGEPLDEALLSHALGAVSEQHFRTMFGLDHERLREGAQALLAGKGDVGESLFDAGVGGGGIHHVLEKLEREAEELFTPRAQTRKLNIAIKEFKDAHKRSRLEGVSAEKWKAAKDALEAARLHRDRLESTRRALVVELGALRRKKPLLPLLADRRRLLAERAELGEVVIISPEAIEARQATAPIVASSRRDMQRLKEDISELRARRQGLTFSEGLVEVAEERMQDLRDRLGSHRREKVDLPKRRTELQEAESEVRAILAQLGHGPNMDDADSLRLGATKRERIRALARQREALLAEARNAALNSTAANEQLEALKHRLSRVPDSRDVAPLRHALGAARRLGDGEARITELDGEIEKLSKKGSDQLSRLGLFDGRLEDLRSLRVPSMETVERFVAEGADLDADLARLASRRLELKGRARMLAEQQEQTTEVPTEADLLEHRADRDTLWHAIRRTLERGGGTVAAPDDGPQQHLSLETADPGAFEGSVRRADNVADRLRREADRVAQRTQLLAQRAAIDEELGEIEQKLTETVGQKQAHDRRWTELWLPAAISPLPPVEMRAWLRMLAEVRSTEDRRVDRMDEKQRLLETVERHRALLTEELATWTDEESRDETLSLAMERAAAVIEGASQSHSTRVALEEQVASAQRRLSAIERAVATQDQQRRQWSNAWAGAVESLGLSGDALPEEALAVIDRLDALHHKNKDAAGLSARIEAMERNARQLEEDVDRLVQRHVPEISGLALEEKAAGLQNHYQRARTGKERHAELDEELAGKEAQLRELGTAQSEALAQLSALMEAAGVPDLPSLVLAEQRSDEARRLDEAVGSVERQILRIGDGFSLEQLIEEAEGADPREVRVRLADAERELEEVEDELPSANSDVGSKEYNLEHYRQQAGASEAEAQAQSHLARVRQHAHRYVRTRLSAAILRREIERYREANQGPILARTNELFPELTLHRYSGVRVGLTANDEAVLRCVREDGTEVDVPALSDGTRDQLYLALRLASLERHAEHNEPMPLVLDDILIHFDDDRARAALGVLGALASQTQVLFFTHHRRLLELAREAVPKDRLREHDLGEARKMALDSATV